MIADGGGVPLAVTLTGGNRNDITQLIPLAEAVPPVRGRRGRPRRRPGTVYADRAYDHDRYRGQLRAKGIKPQIARCGDAHGSGWACTGGWWSRHRAAALVPPAAHPLGDSRRHP